MKQLLFLSSIFLLSGCGAVLTTGDTATLSGSPEGIRAMMDGFGGLITDGKASPDQDTAHWIARKEQEKELTKRSMTPGFLQGIFQRNGASNTTNLDLSGAETIRETDMIK